MGLVLAAKNPSFETQSQRHSCEENLFFQYSQPCIVISVKDTGVAL